MRNSLLRTIALVDYCCIHAFLKAHGIRGEPPLGDLQADLMSRHIGVHKTTIYRWNAAVREGQYKPCETCISEALRRGTQLQFPE